MTPPPNHADESSAGTAADELPVIDLAPARPDADIAAELDAACRERGFFLISGHGIDAGLVAALDAAAREFFALPEHEKAEVAMERGGRAWRGWFPLGGELTSGRPDRKEGFYFGAELSPAEVPADGRPMHGPNLFPARPTSLAPLVLEYLERLTDLGHRIVGLLDLGLGVDGRLSDLVADPLVLFRLFGYPPGAPTSAPSTEEWGVGEHTDYGLLTILYQDATGGLEVRDGERWTQVPPVPDTFVCNIGDMLETATGGVYQSTAHRVLNRSDRYRVSMPFFFDPGWDTGVQRLISSHQPASAAAPRWDGANPHLFDGTYGDYVWEKVGKVFPGLR